MKLTKYELYMIERDDSDIDVVALLGVSEEVNNVECAYELRWKEVRKISYPDLDWSVEEGFLDRCDAWYEKAKEVLKEVG